MVLMMPSFLEMMGRYLAKNMAAKICVDAAREIKVSLPTNLSILIAISTDIMPNGTEERKMDK